MEEKDCYICKGVGCMECSYSGKEYTFKEERKIQDALQKGEEQ